jgi:hypothetical protein
VLAQGLKAFAEGHVREAEDRAELCLVEAEQEELERGSERW